MQVGTDAEKFGGMMQRKGRSFHDDIEDDIALVAGSMDYDGECRRWIFPDGSTIVIVKSMGWGYGVHQSRLKDAETKWWNDDIPAWSAWVGGAWYSTWAQPKIAQN